MASNKTWLDLVMEASEDEVDEVIAKAINTKDAQGMEDVNKASTEVISSDAANADPNKLVYDKDLYSQTNDMGDENIAGTVENQPTSDAVTSTDIASGNPTDAATEASIKLSPDELRYIYTECVAQYIREGKDAINKKYDDKVKRAKKFLAGKKNEELKKKKAEKAAKVKQESANINSVIAQLFD